MNKLEHFILSSIHIPKPSAVPPTMFSVIKYLKDDLTQILKTVLEDKNFGGIIALPEDL